MAGTSQEWGRAVTPFETRLFDVPRPTRLWRVWYPTLLPSQGWVTPRFCVHHVSFTHTLTPGWLPPLATVDNAAGPRVGRCLLSTRSQAFWVYAQRWGHWVIGWVRVKLSEDLPDPSTVAALACVPTRDPQVPFPRILANTCYFLLFSFFQQPSPWACGAISPWPGPVPLRSPLEAVTVPEPQAGPPPPGRLFLCVAWAGDTMKCPPHWSSRRY